MSTTSSRAVRVGAVVLAQLALVGVAVWAPLSARLTGDDVVLRVEPVDPVDPFRGAYVQLWPTPTCPTRRAGRRHPHRGAAAGPRRRARHRLRAADPQGEVWVGGPVQRTAPADGLYLTCDDSSWRSSAASRAGSCRRTRRPACRTPLRGGTAVATVKVDAAGHAALVDVTTP